MEIYQPTSIQQWVILQNVDFSRENEHYHNPVDLGLDVHYFQTLLKW